MDKSFVFVVGPDEQSVDEEDFALNQAIIDAARLEYKDHADLAVDSILIDNISPENESGTHQNNQDKEEMEAQDASNDTTTVSTLIVSERKYSGTESVQINEKLINREN